MRKDTCDRTDLSSLSYSTLREKDQSEIEQLTRRLQRRGVDSVSAGQIAERVHALAEGPIAHDDWMKLDAERFSPRTVAALERQGLLPEHVAVDAGKAEVYAAQVFALEGIPDGNGGTERVNGVSAGHYDDAGHGIDIVAADAHGVPIPIEVKKYGQPSAASLEDRSVEELEPAVQRWRKQRESKVRFDDVESPSGHRPDSVATWKPEVDAHQKQIEQDKALMESQDDGHLPIRQMDDLWTCDRWLKLIKTPEGQARLRDIGVEERFLEHRRLSSSSNLPEWEAMLDRRMAVVVNGREGTTGKRLFEQAVAEKRVKRVVMIEF